MTIGTSTTEITYVGNGVDDTFAIPFQYQVNSQIEVRKYDLTDPENIIETILNEDTDYLLASSEVHLVEPDPLNPGDFLDVPLLATERLWIFRKSADIRSSNYGTYQFPYTLVNTELDKIHQRLQELRNEAAGKIGLSKSSVLAGKTLTAEDILDLIDEVAEINAGVLPQAYIGGLPDTEDTWRLSVVGGALSFDVYTSGNWVNRYSIDKLPG